jgi:hypothetical protein
LSNNLAVDLSTTLPVATGGQTAKISGTITNAGSGPAQAVKITLNAPSGWTVDPSNPIQIPAIPPGKSVSVSWSVQIPSGLSPGQYQVAAVTSYTESGTANSTAGTVALQVPYPNLAAAFDNVGVTSNSNTNPTPGFLGFDGIGTTYSAEGLTAAGLSPGATVQVGGVTLTWPDPQPAQPDNVLANGQAFLITGQSNQLAFLLASNNAPLSGPFITRTAQAPRLIWPLAISGTSQDKMVTRRRRKLRRSTTRIIRRVLPVTRFTCSGSRCPSILLRRFRLWSCQR